MTILAPEQPLEMADAPVIQRDATDSHTAMPPWPMSRLIAFRFCVIYFGLYVVTTQMLGMMFTNPLFGVPDLSVVPPFRNFTFLVGELLPLNTKVTLHPTGSGDTLFNWVQVVSLLMVAVVATALWSVWKREGAPTRLYKWFRLFMRFAVGAAMITYGVSKVIPLQMPTLWLARLVEPFGNFSPMGVLWASIGASPAYEIFIGCAEVFAGVLLFLPRTTMLGAMVALMNSIGIFALNMTYDVPVKLFSFHLILMSLFLLAPDIPRLVRLFLLDKPVGPSNEPRFGSTPASNRKAVIAQAAFGVYLLVFGLYGSVQGWSTYGGGAPKSPLFGIWEVQEYTEDGVSRPPLTTDGARWRYLIFQRPTMAVVQRMNDSISYVGTEFDTLGRTVMLRYSQRVDTLSINRDDAQRLRLTGRLNGKQVEIATSLRNHDDFELRKRGFNWVQEYPYNR